MSKANYTKVEEALEEGLRKIEASRLLAEADAVAAGKSVANLEFTKEHYHLLLRLQSRLRALEKQKKDPFANMPFNKEEMTTLIGNPATIDKEGWEKIENFEKGLPPLFEGTSSEEEVELIEKKRKEEAKKRFNTRDKWIPLH